MTLSEMTTAAFLGDEVTIAGGWGQGRATFGGAVAAVLLARLRGVLTDPNTPLRTVTVFFLGPVRPGPVTVTAEVLRAGSAVTIGRSQITSGSTVLATAEAAFGASRESTIAIDGESRATRRDLPKPAELTPIPYVPGVTPDFFQRADVRPAYGGLPYSGAERPDFGGWMRLRETIEDFGAEHLLAITDLWPPSVIPMLRTPGPASSLAWTFDLLHSPRADQGSSWWQYDVHTEHFADGYGVSRALVWDEDGSLVATSRQTITVFG